LDASAYFGPGVGSEFQAYPLPSSRLGDDFSRFVPAFRFFCIIISSRHVLGMYSAWMHIITFVLWPLNAAEEEPNVP
jgi:hypothetical protein